MNLHPDSVRQEIARLLLLYPELAEDDVLRADMIEAETTVHEFLSRVLRRLAERQALAVGISEYAKDIGERKARVERGCEALRDLIFKIMNDAKLRKVELPEATLSVRATGPKVIITDEAALPDICIKIKREPDKTAIKESLASGQHVPGAELSNGSETLSIRIK
jgi:hypothetical protein